ncbi:MAG TPA: TspO/MBR family protein [Burkholderiales bacterium]|nr:TspO/MBR family protein [Burkholderiales bacterium]
MSEIPGSGGRNLVALAGFAALCFAIAAAGGATTATSVGTWYAGLAKPAFNPPDWVFGPVWTVLYLMIAVAGWRVWRRRAERGAWLALGAWGVQLSLNLSWSLLFFGARMIGAALAEIVVLLAAILVTAALSWRIDRLAGALLVPYAAWVGFATVLNAALWRLN